MKLKVRFFISFLVLFGSVFGIEFKSRANQCDDFLNGQNSIISDYERETLFSILEQRSLDFNVRKNSLLAFIQRKKGRMSHSDFFKAYRIFSIDEQENIAQLLSSWPSLGGGVDNYGWANYQTLFILSISQVLTTGTQEELLAILNDPIANALYVEMGARDYVNGTPAGVPPKIAGRRGVLANNYTVLMYAAENGYLEVVKLLVEEFKVNINLVGKKEHWKSKVFSSAISHAVFYNQNKKNSGVISYLIEKGAILSTQEYGGLGPLYYAAAVDDVETIELLLKHGVDINDRGFNNTTALFGAAEYGQVGAAKFLLNSGINSNIVLLDNNGSPKIFNATAAAVARQNGYIEVADVILAHKKASQKKEYNPQKLSDRIWRYFQTL